LEDFPEQRSQRLIDRHGPLIRIHPNEIRQLATASRREYTLKPPHRQSEIFAFLL
jgi:hypothetical protein